MWKDWYLLNLPQANLAWWSIIMSWSALQKIGLGISVQVFKKNKKKLLLDDIFWIVAPFATKLIY